MTEKKVKNQGENKGGIGVYNSVPILFGERGTRRNRTRDETQSNVGRDAIERRPAFAEKST